MRRLTDRIPLVGSSHLVLAIGIVELPRKSDGSDYWGTANEASLIAKLKQICLTPNRYGAFFVTFRNKT
jgi:hypothetical protein